MSSKKLDYSLIRHLICSKSTLISGLRAGILPICFLGHFNGLVGAILNVNKLSSDYRHVATVSLISHISTKTGLFCLFVCLFCLSVTFCLPKPLYIFSY